MANESLRRRGGGFGYEVGLAAGVPMSMSAGIKRASPEVNNSVPRTTAGSSPAPRAVWTTSSS